MTLVFIPSKIYILKIRLRNIVLMESTLEVCGNSQMGSVLRNFTGTLENQLKLVLTLQLASETRI